MSQFGQTLSLGFGVFLFLGYFWGEFWPSHGLKALDGSIFAQIWHVIPFWKWQNHSKTYVLILKQYLNVKVVFRGKIHFLDTEKKPEKKIGPKVGCSPEKFFHILDIFTIFHVLEVDFKITKQFSLGRLSQNWGHSVNFCGKGLKSKFRKIV